MYYFLLVSPVAYFKLSVSYREHLISHFPAAKKTSRVCDYLVEVYPENADLIYFVSDCHPFHRFSFLSFFFQFRAVGNLIEAASHIPSRSLIQHVSGTVELLLDDVMNADIGLNRELVERVLIT